MVRKIHLELTEDQARVLMTACEFYARIKMGQFQEISWHCAPKHCPDDPAAVERAWLELRKLLFPDLHGVGHSYGMGYDKNADAAYDIYQVVRQHFGDPRGVFSYNKVPKCWVEHQPDAPEGKRS